MKRGGITNTHLAAALATLRHTDIFVIADSGFPAPRGSLVVDLALVYGQPTVTAVLRSVLAEVVVEHTWVASEQAEHNATRHAEIRDAVAGISLEHVAHERLKEIASAASFVVRTGDDLPYSNIVLRAGVGFPV